MLSRVEASAPGRQGKAVDGEEERTTAASGLGNSLQRRGGIIDLETHMAGTLHNGAEEGAQCA